jgi:hypothetical protein
MKNILKKILIFSLPLVLNGCVEDPFEGSCPNGDNDGQIEITVMVPGLSAPQTRSIAGAEGEAKVETLDVLVFEKNADTTKPDVLAEHVSGNIISQSDLASDKYRVTFKASLNKNPDATSIAVVANASAAVAAATVTIGAEKQTVLAALTFTNPNPSSMWIPIPDNALFKPIPMYGERSVSGGIVDGMTLSDIELTRMLARIDVVNNASNLTVTEVYLYAYQKSGYIAPAWNSANGQLLTSLPADPMLVPGGTTAQLGYDYATYDEGNGLEGIIYANESAKTTGVENTAGHTGATCLIIEGKIAGDQTTYYYRVDFTEPYDMTKAPGETGYVAPSDVKYMPLYRNHLYKVDITQVDGPGYTDITDAHKSMSVLSNLKTRLHVVDQSGINDLVYDGQHWLGTDESLLIFSGEGGMQNLDARTNYFDGWQVENIVYNTGSAWLSSPTTATAGSGETASAAVTCIANPDGVVRSATFQLTAGRLRKTITVVQLPLAENIITDSPAPAGMTPYVGAFWRAEQTGERLIRIPRPASEADGAWTATVWEGKDWITLDKTMTTDANVGWLEGATDGAADFGNDAGFDDTHAVSDGAEYVTGLLGATPAGSLDLFDNDPSQIYFRIGLKSKYTPTATAPARYGLVLLTYAGNTKQQRIWIRQGEDADYLMAPGDANSSGLAVADNRSYAAKFVPYNLTDPARNTATNFNNITPMGKNGGEFTDYPSQAGYYFTFQQNRVGYPTPDGSAIANWGVDNTGDFAFTWNPDTDETCPVGYRRPAETGTIAGSEMRQSLWANPIDGNLSTSDNLTSGYYADGWFDRRAIVATFNNNTPAAAVATPGSEVAYRGVLLVNTVKSSSHYGASLFLPAGGRYIENGVQGGSQIGLVGNTATMWPSTTAGGSPKWYGEWNAAAVSPSARMYQSGLNYGYAVRCVKDN